tara:strand:+ start:878 stop:2671 length:1794 start_codon:yes stop_codon:yes gene_type:complete
MPAIQPAMFTALKTLLNERYVPHLPPLLGAANAANKPEKQTARALSAFTLQALFAVDPKTAAHAVVDDYNDNGVDAIYYHETDKTLYFVQSKLKASEQFQLAEAQAFLSGIKLLIAKQYDQFNQNVKNQAGAIDRALDECDQIKLLIAYTGDGISIQASNEIQRVIQAEIDEGEEQLQLQIIDFGPQQIEEMLRQEQAIKLVNDKIRIHKYRSAEGQRKTYFGIVKVSDLIKLHNKHGKGLYEKNIRYFIGSGKRGVNSAIKETLKNEPQHFLHLNNGITIVGNSIKQRAKSRDNNTSRDFEVLGMSVVNGAQTISSAAQFLNENPEADISQAQVMLTLINTGSDSFHKQVTKARNLQNPVDLSNFAALDDNQERLRQEMALYGVEYHYRPQRQLSTGVKIIEIETLAKALACKHSDVRYPARLKSEPSAFTNASSSDYTAIFALDLAGHIAINSVTVYQVIQELTVTADKTSPSPERLVYRHCGYAIASVLMKQLKTKIEGAEILKAEDIKTLISATFDEVRQKFADQYRIDGAGSAHHAFFKRIPDTAKLIQRVCISQQNLSADPAVKALTVRLDEKDPYNQGLSNYLAGKAVQL